MIDLHLRLMIGDRPWETRHVMHPVRVYLANYSVLLSPDPAAFLTVTVLP